MTAVDRIHAHMEEVHGGMYEPDPPPSPIPAPPPVLPQVPAEDPPYGQQARTPFRPMYDDLIEFDDVEDPQNPFLGVDYRANNKSCFAKLS